MLLPCNACSPAPSLLLLLLPGAAVLLLLLLAQCLLCKAVEHLGMLG